MGCANSGNIPSSYGLEEAPSEISYRTYNNIFNPDGLFSETCYEDVPVECEKDCSEHPIVHMKFYPSEEQFEYIFTYCNDDTVRFDISMFMFTEEQFKKLFYKKVEQYKNSEDLRDYLKDVHRFICDYGSNCFKFQYDLIVDVLKSVDLTPDLSDSHQAKHLKHDGYTPAEEAAMTLCEDLLEMYTIGKPTAEIIAAREKIFNEVIIPIFDPLEQNNYIGKRWWYRFNRWAIKLSKEFIKANFNRFSVRELIKLKFEYKDLLDNDEFKKFIIDRLEDNIKDELGIYGIEPGMVNCNIDFDIDQLILFKYFEDEGK